MGERGGDGLNLGPSTGQDRIEIYPVLRSMQGRLTPATGPTLVMGWDTASPSSRLADDCFTQAVSHHTRSQITRALQCTAMKRKYAHRVLRLYLILQGFGPMTIDVKSGSGNGSSISNSNSRRSTLQIVLIWSMANCCPMHAWRPPPNPR